MLRSYQPNDLPAVTRFLGECWQHDPSRNYHPGDFLHWMGNSYRGEKLDEHFYVVEENAQILAIAELDANSGCYAAVIDPTKRGEAWELEFHRACLNILYERIQTTEGRTITFNCSTKDTTSKQCLEQLGFKAKSADYIITKRSLDNVPSPEPPKGFNIRSVAGEHEAQLVADVHNSAFKPKWNETEYLKVMRTPAFDIEQELVIVAPDARFAAFTIIWLDPISQSGLFEPVGCHSDFRRQGLTTALMYAGMTHMKTAGMETAIVAYEATNKAACKLYTSVGFETYFKTVDYILEIKNT